MPSEQEVAEWERQFPQANVALVLGGGVVAVDCDASDASEATLIGEAANVHFGPSPVIRVGRWPRHARLYRAQRVGTRKLPEVEFKARGQLITVYGDHPDTGEPYRYGSLEIKDLRPEDLPLIRRKSVREFFAALGDGLPEERRRRGTTGLTYDEAMKGVHEGQRHDAMMAIAYAARGRGWPEAVATAKAALAAARCIPPLDPRDGEKAVEWVYKHLPPRRGDARSADGVPRILQIGYGKARASYGARGRAGRYVLFLPMCREVQQYLRDQPIALPQPALAALFECSQQAISKLIQRAVRAGALTPAEGDYCPGRRAKRYRVDAPPLA